MRVRGPHGSTVDAPGVTLLAASALAGVSNAAHHGTPGDAHRHHASEQQATGGVRRLGGPIEDTMIRLKIGRCAATYEPLRPQCDTPVRGRPR